MSNLFVLVGRILGTFLLLHMTVGRPAIDGLGCGADFTTHTQNGIQALALCDNSMLLHAVDHAEYSPTFGLIL